MCRGCVQRQQDGVGRFDHDAVFVQVRMESDPVAKPEKWSERGSQTCFDVVGFRDRLPVHVLVTD